jgi:hypothetical protein
MLTRFFIYPFYAIVSYEVFKEATEMELRPVRISEGTVGTPSLGFNFMLENFG